jgi:hypothetical protein
VSDSALRRKAWELSRAELEHRSCRWYDQVLRIFESTKTVAVTQVYGTGPGVGTGMAGEKQRERLAALEFALADVVDAFDAEECRALRDEDRLPEDFLDRVARQAKVVAKQVRW